MIEKITTDRLTLIPLNPAQLREVLEQPKNLETALGLSISRAIVTPRVQRAIHMKLDRMVRENLAHFAWSTYWLLVIDNLSLGAGLAGFKGPPDEGGEVEIGYGIDPHYQGKGYMTEAVKALITWAFQDPNCQAVVARDTLKSNAASLRLLTKSGLTVYHETEDVLHLRLDRAAVGGPGRKAKQSP